MRETTLEATYENGVLRLTRPIDQANGTRVDVTITLQGVSRQGASERVARTPAQLVAGVAVLPMESTAEGFCGEDHDRVLYGDRDGARCSSSIRESGSRPSSRSIHDTSRRPPG